jgi:alpha-N-acetylglucosamine transferase
MNITTPEALSTAIWKRLLLCCPLVIVVVAIVTLRLPYLAADPTIVSRQLIEMAYLRIGLLLIFHTAPTAWVYLIYKGYRQRLITIPIYQSMALLRMPLATWTAGCLVTAIIMWPMLGG